MKPQDLACFHGRLRLPQGIRSLLRQQYFSSPAVITSQPALNPQRHRGPDMAPLDVFANPSSSASAGIPYVFVIQSDLLDALDDAFFEFPKSREELIICDGGWGLQVAQCERLRRWLSV